MFDSFFMSQRVEPSFGPQIGILAMVAHALVPLSLLSGVSRLETSLSSLDSTELIYEHSTFLSIQ
jgi:hypothetical protein